MGYDVRRPRHGWLEQALTPFRKPRDLPDLQADHEGRSAALTVRNSLLIMWAVAVADRNRPSAGGEAVISIPSHMLDPLPNSAREHAREYARDVEVTICGLSEADGEIQRALEPDAEECTRGDEYMTGYGNTLEFMLRLEPGQVEDATRALEQIGVRFNPTATMMYTQDDGWNRRENTINGILENVLEENPKMLQIPEHECAGEFRITVRQDPQHPGPEFVMTACENCVYARSAFAAYMIMEEAHGSAEIRWGQD